MPAHLPSLLLLLALASAPFAVHAEQEGPTHNLVALNVDASAEVDNDLLVAVLYAQREGSQPARLAGEVNEAVNQALSKAKATPGVKVQTHSYETNPVYRNNQLSGWRVSQAIRLESREAAVLSELVGQLQQQLAVQSLGFEVSDEARRRAEEALTGEALQRFTERARLVTQQLGRSSYRLVRIDINSSGGPIPRPMMRSMAMGAEVAAAPPALEPGTQRLAVTVSGTIELTAD
jgi:predicted secreted protein